MKKGRKPARESSAGSIRARLMAWRDLPVDQRPSLRAIAEELGISHQLLSHYLKGLSQWQWRETYRKMEDLKKSTEGRLMSPAEQAQMVEYGRAALNSMVYPALDVFLEKLTTEAKTEGWTRKRVKLVERAARKGFASAQKLLRQIRKNLPAD